MQQPKRLPLSEMRRLLSAIGFSRKDILAAETTISGENGDATAEIMAE